MSAEASLDALAAEATGLFGECVELKNSVTQLIANAVLASENAAIAPIMTMATNLIDTQTMLVKILSAKVAL